MSKTNGLFAVLAVLSGSGAVLLYAQNNRLDGEIRENAAHCEQQIAQLQERYQAEIAELRRYLLEQYNRQPESVVEAEQPTFNQLVSGGHRMQAIGSKYEFLLESALLDAAGKEELRKLLYRWERLTDTARARRKEMGAVPGELQSELANTETGIQSLLTDPLDYQHFLRLRQGEL
jgi:hypothetical protein